MYLTALGLNLFCKIWLSSASGSDLIFMQPNRTPSGTQTKSEPIRNPNIIFLTLYIISYYIHIYVIYINIYIKIILYLCIIFYSDLLYYIKYFNIILHYNIWLYVIKNIVLGFNRVRVWLIFSGLVFVKPESTDPIVISTKTKKFLSIYIIYYAIYNKYII